MHHRPGIVELVILAFLFQTSGFTATAADNPRPSLVRAKVTKVGEKGPEVAVTLEIVHVYSGPSELLKRTFGDTQRSVGDLSGKSARTPFEVGEEGIWVLYEHKGVQSVGRPPRELGWPLWYRSREKEDGAHADVEEVAEAIERVEKAKADEQFTLLKDYASTTKPLVTTWALSALCNLKDDEAGKYLDELAAKPEKLPMTTQLALDEVMARWKGADWSESKPRLVMLRGWVNGKRSESDAGAILVRLSHAHVDHETPDKVAVELACAAADNREWAWAIRREAYFQVCHVASKSVNDEVKTAAYEWMFDKVRTGDDVESRRLAAEAIRYNFTLYPARLKAIEEHLQAEKDEQVAASLRAAVKKAKKEK
jgi:hypothetical protein